MKVFRLCKAKYAHDLSGTGAEKSGGRWNSKGVAMIYTSESRALCTTEIAVHTPLGNLPDDYSLVTLEIPDPLILNINTADLPFDWKTFPHSKSTQKIGDDLILKGKNLIFRVPSVVVQGEFNYLINPKHSDIKSVKILKVEPFTFDERLFKK